MVYVVSFIFSCFVEVYTSQLVSVCRGLPFFRAFHMHTARLIRRAVCSAWRGSSETMQFLGFAMGLKHLISKVRSEKPKTADGFQTENTVILIIVINVYECTVPGIPKLQIVTCLSSGLVLCFEPEVGNSQWISTYVKARGGTCPGVVKNTFQWLFKVSFCIGVLEDLFKSF